METLQKLTEKEEEVMRHYWLHGEMTVREALESYEEPRPHFNTISTYVHILESKGYLRREKRGASLYFMPAVDLDEYRKMAVKGVISRFFNNSYRSIVSAFVKDEAISVDELKEIIDIIERQNQD